MKSDMEHQFTSTGIKFWRHPAQMNAYRVRRLGTVISTHISPTSECNLHCRYCSVSKRTAHNMIPLAVIKDYVTKLKTCGLRAVIITGGGEPLMYRHINELIIWLRYSCKLNVALITNGTLSRRLNGRAWQALSWVRLSLNNIPDFLDRVTVNLRELRSNCTVGSSIIHAGRNKDWAWLRQTQILADRFNMQYIRVLPDCMLPQEDLAIAHWNVACVCQWLDDDRYFHQRKNHSTPPAAVCHQAYFRPYLSEEPCISTGEPGSVYPCDSVVLNDGVSRFASKYQLCPAGDVLRFLSRSIAAGFKPCEDCSGCVFADNLDLLEQWSQGKLNRFARYSQPLEHEDFV
jgi:hypothetical protein